MANWREQIRIDAQEMRTQVARAVTSPIRNLGRNLAAAPQGIARKLGEEGRAAAATLGQVFDLRLRSGESFLSQPQQSQRDELTQEQSNGRRRSR